MSNDLPKLPRLIIGLIHDSLRHILTSGDQGIRALYSLRRASIDSGYAMDRASARILLRAQLLASMRPAPDDRAIVQIPTTVVRIATAAIRVHGPTVVVRPLNDIVRELGE